MQTVPLAMLQHQLQGAQVLLPQQSQVKLSLSLTLLDEFFITTDF